MRHSPFGLLMMMSAIWGLTWIAVKTGVGVVPPLFFAATRFVAAGVILLILFRKQINLPAWRARWVELAVISALLTTFCYGPLFWGIQHTPSGVAAIINLSLIPVGLLTIGAAFRAESLGVAKSVGVVVGIAGLIVMFAPELRHGATVEAAGVMAIALGTLSACLGSVLAKRWLNDLQTGGVSGVLILMGGVGLGVLSALFEPVSWKTWSDLMSPVVFGSWAFLVAFGSIIAFTLYLHLLKVWGPLRAGLYAFISPIVALAAGYAVLGERLEPIQLAASALLIIAAAIVMAPRNLNFLSSLHIKTVPPRRETTQS